MNISIYVDAKMHILDMNTDETMHERGMNDVQNSGKLQVKNSVKTFRFICRSIKSNTCIFLQFNMCMVQTNYFNILRVLDISEYFGLYSRFPKSIDSY